MPTGQSIPGAMMPSTRSASASRSIAELVLGRDDRAAVRVTEPGRVGIAVDGDHVQVALVRGGEQPELRRARA